MTLTLFMNLIDVPVDRKAPALRHATNDGTHVFEIELSALKNVPGCPFAYWAPKNAMLAFSRFNALHGNCRLVVSTNPLNADFRYARLWWEVPPKALWRPWAKGGAFSRFYYDPDTVITWNEKRSTYSGFLGTENRPLERPASVQHFFRPGLTWPRRTNGLSFRAMPAGCIFADKGPAAFAEGDSPSDLLGLCAMMNSQPFGYLVGVQLARTELAQSYEVGLIQQTPIPYLAPAQFEILAQLARRAWSLKRTLDTVRETSHAFLLPSVLRIRLGKYDPPAIETALAEIQSAIDDLAFRSYELDGEDRAAIESWASRAQNSNAAPVGEDYDETDEADSADTTAALYSWAVGASFFRFDIRLATGERQAPPEPEPFDLLPARSPSMIPEADESQFPPRPLLVDDPGHPLDLVALAGDVLERVGFAPESPEALRRWLARDFFPLHIKMYSKSHRKAPIYWQLATPSASYSVWLYIHAFSRDALYKVQEIVELKLRHEERKLESLRADSGASPTAAQRKVLERQESFVDELRAFLEEVKRVAPLWNPDLDDGVVINFAPLWRLVPHHKPWQKELKATWDALCAEEYDWSHLTMHLWPERVVPKCATDRSLAIAHGLEDVFWMEGEDGKWKPRPVPSRPVEELVRERTSPAVKAALEDLLQAPVAPSGGGRGRPRRGRRAGGATA